MPGRWFFRPDHDLWSLIAGGVEQITVSNEQLGQTCAIHQLTRREALEWIASRPKAPYSKRAA